MRSQKHTSTVNNTNELTISVGQHSEARELAVLPIREPEAAQSQRLRTGSGQAAHGVLGDDADQRQRKLTQNNGQHLANRAATSQTVLGMTREQHTNPNFCARGDFVTVSVAGVVTGADTVDF